MQYPRARTSRSYMPLFHSTDMSTQPNFPLHYDTVISLSSTPSLYVSLPSKPPPPLLEAGREISISSLFNPPLINTAGF